MSDGARGHITLMEMLKLATAHLEKHGSTSPRLDAEVMLADQLGMRRLDLYLSFDRAMTHGEIDAYRERTRRRARGEPVAYITGRREFMGHEFAVAPAVLVPRPETESLVELAIDWARERGGVSIADVGTGSGAIAISLALALPRAHVIATDISSEALEVARANVERHGVGDRTELRQGSLLDPVVEEVDLLTANLPYVRNDARERLAPTVLEYEPHIALFGGDDGLILLRPFLADAPRVLHARGAVLCELDCDTAPGAAAAAAEAFPDAIVELLPAIEGQERILQVTRPG